MLSAALMQPIPQHACLLGKISIVMKLKFVQYLVCLLLLGGMSAQAQVYRTAIGARFEEDAVGFSVAQKVGRKVTMEGILIGNNLAELRINKTRNLRSMLLV